MNDEFSGPLLFSYYEVKRLCSLLPYVSLTLVNFDDEVKKLFSVEILHEEIEKIPDNLEDLENEDSWEDSEDMEYTHEIRSI